MKKKKSKLIIGIMLLLAALAAGAYWAWSNPLFGRRLSLADLNPSQTQADKETVDAEGGVQAASGASASAESALEPATDAEIQAQLAEEAPEMAALLQAQESARIEGKESLTQTQTAAGQTACSSVGAFSALVLGIDQMEQADAIRLVQVDFVEQEVIVLAVPRDLFVPIPAMQVHGINQGRINATYGYGEYYNGRGGGVAMLADTLQANFGVSFDHYVVLHFASISRYIDLLGGVDLVLERGVDGRPEGFRYFFAGKNHFDGQTAVDFMRIRVYDSDFRRVDRQTQVLLAAYDKFIQQDLLKQAGLLAQALTDRGVVTDLALNEAYALNCLGTALSRDDVRFISIPSDLYRPATTSAGGNVQLPQPGLKQFIQQQMGIHSQ